MERSVKSSAMGADSAGAPLSSRGGVLLVVVADSAAPLCRPCCRGGGR